MGKQFQSVISSLYDWNKREYLLEFKFSQLQAELRQAKRCQNTCNEGNGECACKWSIYLGEVLSLNKEERRMTSISWHSKVSFAAINKM